MSPIRKQFAMLGPGIIFAVMTIGKSHVVILPAAGAYWGFSLLWVVLLAHVFTYPYYEFGVRYVCATGESIIGAWSRFIAGRGWLIWFLLFGLAAIAPFVFATYLTILGTITVSLAPQYPGYFSGAAFTWTCITLLFVILGKYKGLEWLGKAFALMLMIVFAVAFFSSPPPAGEVLKGFVPTLLPVAALSFLVPIMALPGSPADITFVSSWIMEKRKEWKGSGESAEQIKRDIYKSALFDFRLGWVVIIVVSFFVFSLGAAVLYPDEIPVGAETMMVISRVFTHTIGGWTYPLFITGVVIAIWSTATFAVDGISRVGGVIINALQGRFAEAEHLSPARLFSMFWMAVLGLLTAIYYQEPVFLALVAGAAYLIMFPLCYIMTIWAAKNLIEDPKLRPPKALVGIAIAGLCWVIIGMLLLGYLTLSGFQVHS